jgi:hypothetical protein
VTDDERRVYGQQTVIPWEWVDADRVQAALWSMRQLLPAGDEELWASIEHHEEGDVLALMVVVVG